MSSNKYFLRICETKGKTLQKYNFHFFCLSIRFVTLWRLKDLTRNFCFAL